MFIFYTGDRAFRSTVSVFLMGNGGLGNGVMISGPVCGRGMDGPGEKGFE